MHILFACCGCERGVRDKPRNSPVRKDTAKERYLHSPVSGRRIRNSNSECNYLCTRFCQQS